MRKEKKMELITLLNQAHQMLDPEVLTNSRMGDWLKLRGEIELMCQDLAKEVSNG